MAWKFAMSHLSHSRKCLTVVAAMSLAACGAEHKASLAANSAAGRHAAALTDGECDLDGTWAIKINVPVLWTGSMLVAGGEGTLTQYVKAKRTRNGNTMHESLTVCGIVLPDYKSQVGHKYASRFPESLFDDGQLDTIEVDSHFSSFAPGATFNTDSVISQLGVALPAPLTDPWPARWKDMHHLVDSDQDGRPGITLVADTTNGYSLPVTRPPFSGAATKFYTAIRNVADISGTQNSCDAASGEAVIHKIDGKPALNSHVLGCELVGGAPCEVDQTNTLDKHQPLYLPKSAGTVVMMRIDDDATCETVRNLVQ